nr:molecular chaperone TorD family protein [uncultured Pseudodesulfovibrio sp.]
MEKSDTYFAAAIVCAFFGRVFLHDPEKEFITQVHDENLLAEWPLDTTPDVKGSLDVLSTCIADLDDQGVGLLQDDYNSLFVIPDSAVPVWESVWTTKERLLFGDPTFAVREAYARYGVVAPKLNNEPDDHIGLELDFMARLFALSADAMEAGDAVKAAECAEDVRTFYQDHFGKWAKDCLSEIASKATTAYYKSMARLCMDTMDSLPGILEQ